MGLLTKLFGKESIKEKSLSNYLLYAIGEIILIVIGILIAMQISIWNENRKSERSLHSILELVKSDFEKDSIQIVTNLKSLEQKDSVINRMFSYQFDSDSLQNCFACISLILNHFPLSINKSGFIQLQNLKKSNLTKDSLYNDILTLHNVVIPLIEELDDNVEKIVLENTSEFSKMPWFNDLVIKKDLSRVNEYLVLEEYKNKVLLFKILAIDNLLASQKQYKRSIRKILERINKRIN